MGKIVAFWSNVHGQSGTTSNMVAIACVIALRQSCKCLLMQTHFNMNNLEACLIGNREYSREVFTDIGIDGLTRSIKLAPLDEETICNYTISLLNKKLTLIPGTTCDNRTMFHDDMEKAITVILKEAVKYYDIVFIDINSGCDTISKIVLDIADLTIVNLCQNKSVLDNYFNYWQLKGRNIMYLLGSFDINSSYNLFNLKSLYKSLSKSPVSEIPYYTKFRDAQSDGNVLKFLYKNMALEKTSEGFYFMECLKKASDCLLKLLAYRKGGVENDC